MNITILTSLIQLNSDQFTNPSIISSLDPIENIDPDIIEKIAEFGGLESVEDYHEIRIIILFDSDYSVVDFNPPDYLDIINYYSINNGLLAYIQLNKIYHLAYCYPQISGIWLDHQESSLLTESGKETLDSLVSSSGSPNDFMDFTDEIGAKDLWDKGINGTNVVIAIMDSGVDLTGQIGGDLDDFDENTTTPDVKFIGAVSMLPEEPLYYTDFNGAGTYHAGLACGTGALNKSYVGVAPGAQYLNVKIYDSVGLTFWSFMISGIEWAVQHSADVLLFCRDIPGVYLDPISQAITGAVKKGLVVVVPTGDDGPSYMSVTTPGGALGAISVGAYNMHTQKLASFSGRGPGFDFRIVPDIIAPGVDLIGPRSKIISNDTLSMLDMMNGMLGEYGGAVGISSVDMDFSMPDGLFPQPNYGVPINENYTKSSGTGAAAAVTAGAVALLLDAFPLANPQLIRTAIAETGRPITNELNQEGCGILNVSAAYEFLYNYFGSHSYSKVPYSIPLIYTGFITTSDTANWTQNNPDLSDINAYDMSVIFSTQALMDVILISNGTSEDTLNFTQIHLPLNQFGLEFGGRNHWLSEFLVVREFHQMTTTNMGAQDYNRFSGILELNGLYVTVIVETWNYASEFIDVMGEQVVTDYVDRINGYKLSFKIWNLRNDEINLEDIRLISYFKTDLYMNETGALDIDNTEGVLGILDTGLDDNITFDPQTQTMLVSDENNNTDFKFDKNHTVVGFNSTTHQVDSYKIGDSISLLAELTINGTKNNLLDNSTDYIRGTDDPGFAIAYNLTDELLYGDSIEFSGIFSLGIGDSLLSANNSLYEQMSFISTGAYQYTIQDLIVVKASFNRMTAKNEFYNSTALIFNIGNVEVEEAYLIFGANRTTEEGYLEIYSKVSTIRNIGLNDYIQITQKWMPLEEGIYLVGWGIINVNINQFGIPESSEDNLLNNFIGRSVHVYDKKFYNSILYDSFRAYPHKLDQEPMKIHFPGDIGLINISTYGILDIPQVTIGLDGPGSAYMMMIWGNTNLFAGILNNSDLLDTDLGGTSGFAMEPINFDDVNNSGIDMDSLDISSVLYTDLLKPLDMIFCLAFGPLLCPQGIVSFNITFSSPDYGGVFYRIPVEFEFNEYRGRVFFDGIHNFLMMDTNFSSLTGADMDINLNNFIDLEERLDYPFGGFNDLKELWADRSPKGVATQTFLPGLSINVTSFLSGFTSIASETENATAPESEMGISMDVGADMDLSFINDFLGGLAFEGDVLTTNTINTNILQIFDVLIINDPEFKITENETKDIVKWVERGGALFVFAENETECQVDSLNYLLNKFNLTISKDSNNGEQIISPLTYYNTGNIFPKHDIGIVTLQDPVSISIIDSDSDGADQVELLDSNGYFAVALKGRGRVFVSGDKDIFTDKGLDNDDNADLANKLIDFGLNSYFDINVTAKTNEMDLWSLNFFNAEISNYEQLKQYIDEGILFITGFIFEDSTTINVSLYGIALPLMIMWGTEPGNYATYYDSSWYLEPGTYYAFFLIDHPSIAQENIYFEFKVNWAPQPPPVIPYIPQDPEYPHWVDLVGITWIVCFSIILWAYELNKWKRRLNIIQIKGDVLNNAKSKVNEGETMLKQILRSIYAQEDVQEQVRMLLSNRKRMNRYLKSLKKFGEDLGEVY